MRTKKDKLGKVSITIEGEYNVSRDYNKLCLVTDSENFIVYVSRRPVPAYTSINNTKYWHPLIKGVKEFIDATKDATTKALEAAALALLEKNNIHNEWYGTEEEKGIKLEAIEIINNVKEQGNTAEQKGNYAKEQGDIAKQRKEELDIFQDVMDHAVLSENWDEQDDDPEEYDPLAVTEASYAYNWKSTDKPARDGRTQGNLKDLYNSNLELNNKVTELEQEVIFDVSAHNNGVVFESLQPLLSSSNLSTLIPVSVRHGGMSIRFVQSSDNEYVQYRLIATSFSTDEKDWQGVDDEPTVGSNNLVKSGGVKRIVSTEKTSLLDLVNLFNKNKVGNYFIDSNGNPSASDTYITNLDPIYLSASDVISMTMGRFFSYFNENGELLLHETITNTDHSFTIQTDGYALISIYASQKDSFMAVLGSTLPSSYVSYKELIKKKLIPIDTVPMPNSDNVVSSGAVYKAIKEIKDFIVVEGQESTNLFNKDSLLFGFINSSGQIQPSDTYSYMSDYIPVTAGSKLTNSNGCRFISIYNANKEFITNEDATTPSSNTITIASDGFVRVTVYTQYADRVMLVRGDTLPESYIPYVETSTQFAEGIDFNESQKEYIQFVASGSILSGKKWVACGDSYTEGDFHNFTDSRGNFYPTNDDVKVCDEVYDTVEGMFKTYPYFIAKRNGMKLVNEAICGSTMTLTGNQSLSFSYNRYKNIPNDADYITLMFGINDSDANITIGNINSTNKSEFYGAWNVVMDYIRRNHPKSKIGIIVTVRAKKTYTDAIRNIAKRWGVGYLDLMGDYNVSYWLYAFEKVNMSGQSGEMVESMANYLNDKWLVHNSSTNPNYHPNVPAHEYLSSIIENWLRGL